MFTRVFLSAAVLAAIEHKALVEAAELSTGAELQLEQLRAIYAEVQSQGGATYNNAFLAQVEAHKQDHAPVSLIQSDSQEVTETDKKELTEIVQAAAKEAADKALAEYMNGKDGTQVT